MATIDPGAVTLLPESTTSVTPHTSTTPHIVNIGTRKSLLAVKQTEIVVELLKKAWPENEYKVHAISTMGDKNQVTALHEFGAKSLWTHELEAMLMSSEVDLIVHSLKDIPTQIPKGCSIGCILPRADPRDAVVLHPSLPPSTTLSSLPENSTVGTSSVRRSAQLKRLYPHLRFQSVRGNLGTRLKKLDESKLEESKDIGSKYGDVETVDENAEGKPQYSAIILAAAGLQRIDLGHRISRFLSSKTMEETRGADGVKEMRKGILYAVGQGALGIEVREGDQRIMGLLGPLRCQKTTLACLTERSLLRTLEGGCSVPIGVETEWVSSSQGNSTGGVISAVQQLAGSAVSTGMEGVTPPFKTDEDLIVRSIVISIDGTNHVEAEMTRTIRTEAEADQFGWDVARKLVDLGADKILKAINLDRKIIEKQGDA